MTLPRARFAPVEEYLAFEDASLDNMNFTRADGCFQK